MRIRQKSRPEKPIVSAEPTRERCENCGLDHPCYNLTMVGGEDFPSQKLCSFCFNSLMAQDLGVPMPDPCEFSPVVIKDGTGRSHTFHFDLKLEDSGIFLVAFEWVNNGVGGYQFAHFDRFDVSPQEIFEKLIYKVKRSLQVQYLDRRKLALRGDAVNGMFTDVNPETGEPEFGLIVDGRFMSWQEFASCFRDWPGHQFRIECADIAEELPVEAQCAQPMLAEQAPGLPDMRAEEPLSRSENSPEGMIH